MFLKTAGLGCARTGWVGQAHNKSACALAQSALYCASGRLLITEQGASMWILCCHLWSFQKATQTKDFLSSFRLSAEGWGEEPCKEMEGSFWVCPRESASAVGARWQAHGAYERIFKPPRAPRVRSQSLCDWK